MTAPAGDRDPEDLGEPRPTAVCRAPADVLRPLRRELGPRTFGGVSLPDCCPHAESSFTIGNVGDDWLFRRSSADDALGISVSVAQHQLLPIILDLHGVANFKAGSELKPSFSCCIHTRRRRRSFSHEADPGLRRTLRQYELLSQLRVFTSFSCSANISRPKVSSQLNRQDLKRRASTGSRLDLMRFGIYNAFSTAHDLHPGRKLSKACRTQTISHFLK